MEKSIFQLKIDFRFYKETMWKFGKKNFSQIKTPKWIDIILVLIIGIEICYFVFLKIEFINKNSGALQAISTIVLIVITGYFSYQNYKSEQIRLKQPHSERIGEEIQKFLEELNHAILDPRDLKESYYDHIQFLKMKSFPHYPYQHLKSGYPKIYKKYNEWCKAVVLFNRELINFVENSVVELHNWIEKEVREDGTKPDTFYEHRIISYCFKKVLIFGFPDPEHSKSSLEELQRTKSVELRWKGTLMIRANPVLVVRLEDEFIKNFIISKREKIWKFYENFETLKKEANKIFEEIRIEIIDRAKYAGVINGKCDVC